MENPKNGQAAKWQNPYESRAHHVGIDCLMLHVATLINTYAYRNGQVAKRLHNPYVAAWPCRHGPLGQFNAVRRGGRDPRAAQAGNPQPKDA